jgi:hypothetical protein
MNAGRTGTIFVHLVASVATGFVAVAAGVLASDLIGPASLLERAVPVMVGLLVAVGGGMCVARLVPWLVLGGWRSASLASDEPCGAAHADKRRTTHPR